MVGSGVKTRTWTADVVWPWSDPFMRCVTLVWTLQVSDTSDAQHWVGSYWRRDLVSSFPIARLPILGIVVGVLLGDRSSRFMVRVERTRIWATRVSSTALLADSKLAVLRPWRFNAWHVCDPWESISSGEENGEENGLHVCNGIETKV